MIRRFSPLILALGLVLGLGLAAAAASAQPKSGPALTPKLAPKFMIEGGKVFDFGDLRTVAPVERELRILNTGTDTLRISDVSGSCGCTGTLLSNHNIPPGGNGILRITFDPVKFKGKVEKTVSMKTNDTADSNPHITFTANISPILEFEVSHVVVSTAVDSQAATVIAVKNLSDVPIAFSSVRAVPSDLEVTITPRTLKPGEFAELRCSATPGKPGIVKGDIILTTDHPLLPTTGIRYFLYAKPPSGKLANTPDK